MSYRFLNIANCFTYINLIIAHLCWLKHSKAALLSIPIASYYSIERLALIYFSFAQYDHKLNETDITFTSILDEL